MTTISSASVVCALSASVLAAVPDRLFVSREWLDRYDLPSPSPTRVLPPFSGAGGVSGTCSPSGMLYYGIEAGSKSRIHIYDQDGVGPQTNQLPPFADPWGLAFDPDGNLYLNTSVGNGAFRLDAGDPAGLAYQVVPPFNREGAGAAIVAGGPHAGALLLGGRRSHNVFISEPPGAPTRIFIDGASYPPDNSLNAITTNACGEIFISICSGVGKLCSVDRYDPEGKSAVRYATGFGAGSLEFDSDGNLFVADPANGRVMRVATDRTVTEFVNYPDTFANIVICRAPLACGAGGPYREECQGARTCVALHAEPRPSCAEYTWISDCPGADFGGTEAQVDATLCFDTASCPTACRVRLEMKEGIFRSASCESEVVVEDTRPPVFRDVPADETAECDRVPPPPVPLAEDRCDPAPAVGFAEWREDGRCPGEYRLHRAWTASDDCGNLERIEQVVSVVDREAPTVAAGGEDLDCLWPPNHRMVCFGREDFAVTVSDACSEPTTWRFAGCDSDQPDDADERDPASPWGGDGSTLGDCQVEADGLTLCVRAERAGRGPRASAGRRYRLEVEAEDACGNVSAPTTIGFVHVPHDRDSRELPCRTSMRR